MNPIVYSIVHPIVNSIMQLIVNPIVQSIVGAVATLLRILISDLLKCRACDSFAAIAESTSVTKMSKGAVAHLPSHHLSSSIPDRVSAFVTSPMSWACKAK